MHIWSILERAAALFPSKVALVDGNERRTYGQVFAETKAIASALRSHAIAPTDRVAILAWNGTPYFEAYYAVAAIGAVSVPLNVRLAAAEIAVVLSHSGARWVIAEAAHVDLVLDSVRLGARLDGVIWIGVPRAECAGGANLAWADALEHEAGSFTPARGSSSDVAHLYYTSGTTGRAKGVMLTHRNVCVHALAAVAELGLDERDVWAHIAPMFHLADAWATFAITSVGGTHVMLSRFDAALALDLLTRDAVTITNLIPTMLNLMVAHPGARGRDYASLRCILSGGAPISPTLVRAILSTFGCEYIQTYGMTETSPYLTLGKLKEHMRSLPDDQRLAIQARTGRPFLGVELIVVDERGNRVPADDRTVGEIWVRGETVTPGYWNAPDETRAAFHDGWLKTGDLAVLDAEGYVDIVDRKKDMILSGGENVYSVEVEHVLHAHPDVLEVAVFGKPDPLWGEVVHAAVVQRASGTATAGDLEAHCRARLAGFKVPRSFEFLGELPRTGSGKIAKRMLRERSDLGVEGDSIGRISGPKM